MSFSKLGLLVNDLLEHFVLKENIQVEKSSAISQEIRNQLKTGFKLSLFPEIKIQREEEEIETEPGTIQFSTPLKKRRNRTTLWWTKRKFFRNGISN